MSVLLDGIICFGRNVVNGRKTGLMVKDTGRRDSAGLEDMDAFFSPAVEKPTKRGGSLLSPVKVMTSFQSTIASEKSILPVPWVLLTQRIYEKQQRRARVKEISISST
jgi:Kinetochore CENP-C fungal homologue, Mif2, N-terminal